MRRHPALVAALSLGLIMILTAFGGASWLIAARQTNRHAIEVDLTDAVRFQRVAHWSEARTALERARARLGDRGFSDLRDLLHQADGDQAFAARLDEIRTGRDVNERGHIETSRSIAKYESLLRNAGLGDRREDPALVASRIASSNISATLISAIGDWAAITEDDAYLDWLLKIAREAAPDSSGWRERALTLAAWTKPSDLAELIASAPVTENSIPVLLALGERYERQGGNSVELFTKCQKVRPNDFWANLWLGHVLKAHNNPSESLRYYQAAVAIRPDSALAYNYLGLALTNLRRIDDAIETFRAAERLNPAVPP
jgi:serine/threonine-protein kinase